MKDQNQTDQNKVTNTPISSGISPGPGEHLVDASSQPSIASSTPGDSLGAAGSAGMDATSLYGSTDTDQTGGTSRSSRASMQGARQRQSLPYETAASESYDSLGSYPDTGTSSGTMLQNAASQLRGSKGAFLAGTVIAGFLLQRFLQASPGQTSGRGTTTYKSDTSGIGYGADASLDADREFGVETAYSPTGYGAGSSAASGTSSTGSLNRMTDRVKQVGDTARTKLQSTTEGAKARLNDVGYQTKTQYYRAKHRVDTMREEQPLLIGALGVAVGAGLGAMLAVTRRENQLLGGVRDNLMGKAKEIASTQMQTVKESAQRFAEITKQEAQRTKDELAAKVTQSTGQSGAKAGDTAGSATGTAGSASDKAGTSGRNLH